MGIYWRPSPKATIRPGFSEYYVLKKNEGRPIGQSLSQYSFHLLMTLMPDYS